MFGNVFVCSVVLLLLLNFRFVFRCRAVLASTHGFSVRNVSVGFISLVAIRVVDSFSCSVSIFDIYKGILSLGRCSAQGAKCCGLCLGSLFSIF